jgi:hypothetical protein
MILELPEAINDIQNRAMLQRYEAIDWVEVDTQKIRRRIEDRLRKDITATRLVALFLNIKLED